MKMRTPKARGVNQTLPHLNLSSLDDEVLLPERQVADWLAVAPVTLRGWRRQRRGPEFLKLESRPRYPVGAVRRWLAARRGSIE